MQISLGAFHLVKISGISGSAENGTRFVGSSHWKIPRKSGKSKKVVPFSRLEFPNGMSCSIYVSRSLYQFQDHGRAPPGTGVYDQMEQLFTDRKFHFRYHRNFRVFFLNRKRPLPLVWAINRVNITRKKAVLGEASTSFPASRDGLVHNIIRASSTPQEHQENACTVS